MELPRRRVGVIGKWAGLLGRAFTGWAVCGLTVAVGRQFVSLNATLLTHAVAATTAFGLLTWHHVKRHPQASRAVTSIIMLLVPACLDALVVAPFFEHSDAMVGSTLGTWIPFASIVVTSDVVGRTASARTASRQDFSLPNGAPPPHHHVCPWWLGPILAGPIRRLIESPTRLLGPLVRSGMTVIEPGCGMGFFTLALAETVGFVNTGRALLGRGLTALLETR